MSLFTCMRSETNTYRFSDWDLAKYNVCLFTEKEKLKSTALANQYEIA